MTATVLLIEVAGWIGAASLLTSYVLVSAGRLDSRSTAYQILNLVGAVGFITNGWYHRAYPSVMLNVIWLAISIVFLLRIVRTPVPPA